MAPNGFTVGKADDIEEWAKYRIQDFSTHILVCATCWPSAILLTREEGQTSA
jgi:hypothetical protein